MSASNAAVTAESLFREVFWPLYPDDARADLGRARSTNANPARNPHLEAHLDDAARVFVAMAPLALGLRAEDLTLDTTDASIHRLSMQLTKEARDRLLAEGQVGTADSALFNFVVHGAAYVGACIVHGHGGRWAVRRPLWESLALLSTPAGDLELPIFHWWLKALADDARATLADRYRTHVEVPRAAPLALPVIAPEDRKLPKLTNVRFDVFCKYLRANLPELKDVGKDFPSQERFDELGFKHLSFMLVGGGRMLVVSGPTPYGLHAYWLTRSGFEKSAFWPCDAVPAPMIRRAEGDKLEVMMSVGGRLRSFELLYWGL
ncbi:MAG: hypothetical protein FWD73_02155 [Polyangiaceae bacterium]|nr:hypothetical protein [Polyangiaceae bacterium]